MLKRFEVTGYKNFNEKLVLDLSKVRDYHFNAQCVKNGVVNSSIIYGKNAMGKTNLGRAIMDIRRNLFGVLGDSEQSYLNADSDIEYAEFLYEFVFGDNVVTYWYRKTDSNTLLLETLDINGEVIFQYDYVDKKLIENCLVKIQADTLNWQFTDNVISILSYIINNTPQDNDSPLKELFIFITNMRFMQSNINFGTKRNLSIKISSIIENNMVGDLELFLQKFGIQERLMVLELPTGSKILCFDHKKPVPFIQNCSSGTSALVHLYSWYREIDTVSFLYLDEFDAFYHHDLSKKVIDLFNETQNCQIITTSHNTDLLSNKIMRPDCLFILTKNKITSLADATVRELREGHNLEKLYVSGEFDG